jgi:hypothetical protein
MFCAFCGNSIQLPKDSASESVKSTIISKPQITVETSKSPQTILGDHHRRVDGGYEFYNKYFNKWEFAPDEVTKTLSLRNRQIKSLDEIICWYSDNELGEINILDLSDNELTSLKGIERFTGLIKLNISNNNVQSLVGIGKLSVNEFVLDASGNKLTSFDDIFQFKYKRKYDSVWRRLNVYLTNNVELSSISPEVIQKLNSQADGYFDQFKVNFSGCTNFDPKSLKSIKFNRILEKKTRSDFEIIGSDGNYIDTLISSSSQTNNAKSLSVNETNTSTSPLLYVLGGLFIICIGLFLLPKSCNNSNESNNQSESQESSITEESSDYSYMPTEEVSQEAQPSSPDYDNSFDNLNNEYEDAESGEKEDKVSPVPSNLSVGDNYGGGIVANIYNINDDGYVEGEIHGLIASSKDLDVVFKRNDTTYIEGADWNMASSLCENYDNEGYFDWRLPTKTELKSMYDNIGQGNKLGLGNIGQFKDAIFWSSSEYLDGLAWTTFFQNGNGGNYKKRYKMQVRAVRSF